jgi:hypothetical protein
MAYLKGKDIKTKGDCLVKYMSYKIEITVDNKTTIVKSKGYVAVPEELDKW